MFFCRRHNCCRFTDSYSDPRNSCPIYYCSDRPVDSLCTPSLSSSQQPQMPGSTPLSVHIIRPIPKAGPRLTEKQGRKRGRTRILTDTPEKEQLEREALRRCQTTNKSWPTELANKNRSCVSKSWPIFLSPNFCCPH